MYIFFRLINALSYAILRCIGSLKRIQKQASTLKMYLHIISVTPAKGYGKGKTGSPNPLTTIAKMEHAIVGQALLDIIGPRLAPEVSTHYYSLFCDYSLPP